MSSERSIVTTILRRANAIDHCKAIKLHGGPHLEAGTPDVHITYRGRSLWLEVKRPGNTATVLQLRRLEQWRDAGAVTAVVYAWDDVEILLRNMDGLDYSPGREGSVPT